MDPPIFYPRSFFKALLDKLLFSINVTLAYA